MKSTNQSKILAYGRKIAAPLSDSGLIGLYVHGSLALGGFDPERSDVDILAVIADPLTKRQQRKLGEALLGSAYLLIGKALELSVITAVTAEDLGSCPFEVHVATPSTIVTGADHDGDDDLVLYAEVCRRSGITVVGPAAAEVFGVVPESRLRAAIDAELAWGLAAAPFEYAVLNACRAVRFAADGDLVSKVDGGAWFRSARADDPVVRAALAAHRGQAVEQPAPEHVTAFVTAARSVFDDPEGLSTS